MKCCFSKAWKRKAEKLNSLKLAFAAGVIGGVCALGVTLLQALIPGYSSHVTWMLLEMFGFLGYEVSVFGAFLGAIYTFVEVFVIMWILASLYNKLL